MQGTLKDWWVQSRFDELISRKRNPSKVSRKKNPIKDENIFWSQKVISQANSNSEG